MAKAKATATSGKRANGQTTTGKEEVFNMTEKQMQELIKNITASVIATLQESKATTTTKATTKKATTKKATTKKTKTVTAKINPVKEMIMKEQEELAQKFNGKSYGSQSSGDFIAFYRRKENGSYVRIGHFNTRKGLFWFTKKAVTFKDWSYIKSQLTRYSNAADFTRNADRFAKAGIKCPSDFGKVSWETFLTSGIFC